MNPTNHPFANYPDLVLPSIIVDLKESQERQLMHSNQEHHLAVRDDESNPASKKRVGSAPFDPHGPSPRASMDNLMR